MTACRQIELESGQRQSLRFKRRPPLAVSGSNRRATAGGRPTNLNARSRPPTPACRKLMDQNQLRFGSHQCSQRRVRRQHPVVPVAVRARHRLQYQGGDALDQRKGGETGRPACHRSAVWGGSGQLDTPLCRRSRSRPARCRASMQTPGSTAKSPAGLSMELRIDDRSPGRWVQCQCTRICELLRLR